MGFVKTPEELARIGEGLRHPHFREAEMLFVFWETKPEIVARLLPPPLEPGPMALASAFVAWYPNTNFGPAYHEGGLFLSAQYEGVIGHYCLAMPVTGDMAMASGREKYGYPKKLAQIELARRGSEFTGRISRHGRTFFEVKAHVGPDQVAPPVRKVIHDGLALNDEAGAPVYLFKHFMSPDGQGFDYPPRLVRQRNVVRPELLQWAAAQVTLPRSDDDPWYEVEAVNVHGCMFVVANNTMLPGEVVAEVDGATFLPYAWAKWDPAQLSMVQESGPRRIERTWAA